MQGALAPKWLGLSPTVAPVGPFELLPLVAQVRLDGR